jgi:hypothetical protein
MWTIVVLSLLAACSTPTREEPAPTPQAEAPREPHDPSAAGRTNAPTVPAPLAAHGESSRTPAPTTPAQKEEWPEPSREPPTGTSSTSPQLVPPPPPGGAEVSWTGGDDDRAWNGHAWVRLPARHRHGAGCGHWLRGGKPCIFDADPRPAPPDVTRVELLDPAKPFYLQGGRAWALVGHVHGQGCGHVRRDDGWHLDPELGGD